MVVRRCCSLKKTGSRAHHLQRGVALAHQTKSPKYEHRQNNGADVNAKANDGITPLLYAMNQGYNVVAELLRQYGGHE